MAVKKFAQNDFDVITFHFQVSGRPVDLELARRQHADLVAAVRGLNIDVLELPPDETNALSIFTQDLAVVVNGIALMCRPVNSTRKPEVCRLKTLRQKMKRYKGFDGFIHLGSHGFFLFRLQVDTMRAVLKKELNQTIAEPESAKALLSGSDVFFTGREFFIGLSNHTNTDGAMAVATTWPEYPCTPIKVGSYSISTY